MRRSLTWLALGALVASAAGRPALAAGELALAPGDRAPKLVGQTLDRAPWRAEWGGQALTLVNFWATWCEPCKAEIPELARLQTAHAADLRVVGVLMDPVGDQELVAFLAPLGVNYPIIRPSPHVNRDWGGIVVMPITFLVGRDGRIVRRYVGATPEQVAGLAADVEAVLAGRPMAPMVIPESKGFVGDEERLRLQQEEQKREKAGGD
jgi:thiol-disulfide isomerase/thioredoxin